ncbi:unnamed protein product [Cochlearia groenlandica]
MESSNDDDKNLKAITDSVGRLVWVRRGNNSWWPGQTLLAHDQSLENSMVSSKPGTPIKLLCREDVSVEWYVLEKSGMVKPFRCGEYDACIEKAKASALAASSCNNKKRFFKCSRRDDAINNALEIERAHLSKQDHLCSSSGEEDLKMCLTLPCEEAEDVLDSAAEKLRPVVSSVGACKEEPKRRRTPNDSEDEGIKRMRGLEDIGKEHVCGVVLEHKQEETGLICDVKLNGPISNGSILTNGNKVCSRKRSQVIIANECPKTRNQRRQLTKVLECTAIVSVPVACDQLVTTSDCEGNYYDSEILAIESVESMKSVVTCDQLVIHKNKAKDGEISSIIVSAEDKSFFDVPLIEDPKHSSAVPSPKRDLAYGMMTRRSGRSNHDVLVKKEGSNGSSACTNPQATQPVNNCNLNGAEKSTSRWQLKGKRNSRQMSKKQEASRIMCGEQEQQEEEEEEPTNNNTYSLVPYSAPLYEVKIKLIPNHNKPPSVPLVSRMSESYRKVIVGHLLTVEILEEEGYCNGTLMSRAIVKAKPISKKKRKSHGKPLKSKKKPSSSKKTKSISTLTRQSKKLATDKAKKETVLACIPLKLVFSRINQVLKSSTKQTQHRALPSASQNMREERLFGHVLKHKLR